MILEILPDPGKRVMHWDAGLGQDLRVADTRQLQEMRRTDRTGGEDHLECRIGPPDGVPWAAVAREFDANSARPVEYHAVHQRIGDNLEVGAL